MKNSVAFDFRQGRVRVQTLGSGVSAAAYSGMVDVSSFGTLRAWSLEGKANRTALVIDTTKLVTMVDMEQDFFPSPQTLTSLPGVVICREDQLRPWQRYATKLGVFGVLRVVFLESERGQALELAEFFARHDPLRELDLQLV